MRAEDPMARLQAEFLQFATDLPARGQVGYLEQRDGDAEAIRTYYAAQYALVPRIIVATTRPEFLIVARDAELPGGDERLAGFVRVRTLPEGHRLFRRLP